MHAAAEALGSLRLGLISAPTQQDVREVVDLIAATRRKCVTVDGHLAFLRAIDWPSVGEAGTLNHQTQKPREVVVQRGGMEIRMSHPTVVYQEVYVAFDGVICGCVNVTDTISRAINLLCDLKIPEPQASLGRLARDGDPATPLGSVISVPDALAWLEGLRRLRGRCQHADLENVVIRERGPLADSREPLVPDGYAPPAVVAPITVSDYATRASEWTNTIVFTIVGTLLQNKRHAFALKTNRL